MNEIWKDIKGYEGLYEISNLGNVKSTQKKIKLPYNYKSKKPFIVLKRERILKGINRRGYKLVNLSKNNESKIILINRLVGDAFIPNPLNKPYINHKNGVKSDNRIENLEWCTPKENVHHALENGMLFNQIGMLKKLNDKQIRLILHLKNCKPKMTQKEVGKVFGVHRRQISKIWRMYPGHNLPKPHFV